MLSPNAKKLPLGGAQPFLQFGLRPNLGQFGLLATITCGVGLVVGAERVVVPVLAKQDFGLRTAPFLFVLGMILVMLLASLLFVRETHHFTHLEAQQAAAEPGHPHPGADPLEPRPSLAAIFALITWGDRQLAACSQAGLVEKFTNTLAWGLFTLYFASRGLSPAAIGAVVAAYAGTWAVLQIYTGHLTDRLGRKWPIAGDVAGGQRHCPGGAHDDAGGVGRGSGADGSRHGAAVSHPACGGQRCGRPALASHVAEREPPVGVSSAEAPLEPGTRPAGGRMMGSG